MQVDGSEVLVVFPSNSLPDELEISNADPAALSISGADIRSTVVDLNGNIDGDVTLCFWTDTDNKVMGLADYLHNH